MSQTKLGGQSTDAGWTPFNQEKKSDWFPIEPDVLHASADEQDKTQLPKGTPKTLKQAINNGLMIGPLKDCEENVYRAVKDFLSQRFGSKALELDLRNDAVTAANIMALYTEITKD